MESHVFTAQSTEYEAGYSGHAAREIVTQLWDETAHSLINRTSQTDHKESAGMLDMRNLRNYAIPLPVLARALTSETDRRHAFLCKLPELFAVETQIDDVWQPLLTRLIAVIPGADRGALLICDRESNALLLKAYVSSNGPMVSKEFAQRAMNEAQGFIWRRAEHAEGSALEEQGETAMYMPLCWQGHVSGVLCIDSSAPGTVFTTDDLQLLATVAYWAAMAIANHQLQEDSRQQAKVLDRLLTNFSPKVRGKLLERARHGKLRPGGKKSEVTILYADIRGFTQMSADRDAEDIVDVLNTYFSPLIKSIFKYDGTIDKFIGDAVLAVFGSPETDAAQHQKAVRAAWEMQAAVQELNVQRQAQGLVTCDIGIGIHCGEVLHGFIGSAEQVEFTVIGDAVNRASRYCDGAGVGEILVSPEVYQRVWECVKEERVTIETKHEGLLSAHRIKRVELAL